MLVQLVSYSVKFQEKPKLQEIFQGSGEIKSNIDASLVDKNP